MDRFSDERVERITMVFAAQLGKTEAILNCIAWSIDQDPGTTMLVYDSERTADKVMKHRVHRMVEGCPKLLARLRGSLALKEINFERSYLFTAWSNSPGALSSTPCRYVFPDEVDKYLPYSGRESNPIQLAAARTRTYRGRRKIMSSSTPTLEDHYIWRDYLRTDQNLYHVPCPKCGAFQVLDFFRGVKWPKKTNSQAIAEKGLAWYECEKCAAKFDEELKDELLLRGRWVPHRCTIDKRGRIQGEIPSRWRSGFQLSALYSPFATWSELAAKFKDATGDVSLMMGFWNSELGLPWKEKIESVTERKLLGAVRPVPPGEVPPWTMVLTCGVDVQSDHFYFAVRAWGPGERSHLVRHGTVQTWDQVLAVIKTGYRRGGSLVPIDRAMIDSGFRTSEVYDFARKHHPITWPTKGSNNAALVQACKMTRPQPGTALFVFKADFYKDRLSNLISVIRGNPGEWSVHSEVGDAEGDWMKQMLSERRVIKRKAGRKFSTWEPRTESTPNHLWDCEVLNVLAADTLGVRFLQDGDQAPPPPPRRDRSRGEGMIERDPDFMGGAGGLWDH